MIGEKLTMLTAYDFPSAKHAEYADIDIGTVVPRLKCVEVPNISSSSSGRFRWNGRFRVIVLTLIVRGIY